MVAGGGGGRDNTREKHHARESDSSDDDEDDDSEDEEEEAGAKLKFVLPGDDTGSGIDYNILDEESWQKLEEYCKKWGLKQAHLESIYSRFERTIVRTEHLDFTYKPQFHASLDFLADEFMTTAGEFAAQIFIQTWFLRRKRGLKPPKDRRCVDFTRLVIMCCDLARLGDYEILTNLWTCVLQRFGALLPNGTVKLDTKLNTELVREVLTVLHASPDKKLNLLVDTLMAESEELHGGSEDGSKSTRSTRSGNGAEAVELRGDEEEAGRCGVTRRYLSLRSILRFSFQHPPLLFPVVQFQRVLRSKIIGSRYWLRRRKPAPERGLSIRESLGLPDAYHDMFDRIEGRAHAWIVASGHLLLHALDPPPHALAAADSSGTVDDDRWSSGGGGARRGAEGGGDGGLEDEERYRERYRERYDRRYERMLDNCLRTERCKADEKTAPGMIIGAVGGKMIPATLTFALNRFRAAGSKSSSAPKPSPASPVVAAGGVAEKPGAEDDGALVAAAPVEQSTEDPSGLVAKDKTKIDTASPNSRAPSQSSREGRGGGSRGRRGHGRDRSGHSPSPSRGDEDDTPPPTSDATLPPDSSSAAAAAAAAAGGTKTCAICLRKPSPVALCRRCGRRAAKAFKDARGSRQALVLLVPYGAFFGVGEPSALRREGDAVRRWARLFDDETGGDFYYNAHFDTSVWKSAIELPRPAPPAPKISRHRKAAAAAAAAAGVIGAKASSPTSERLASSPASPTSAAGPSKKEADQGAATTSPARLARTATGAMKSVSRGIGRTGSQKTRKAFSASSMAALQETAGGSARGGLHGGGGGGAIIKPALKKTGSSSPSPSRKAIAATTPSAPASPGGGGGGRHKVVVLAAGDAVPDIVLDAHKRMYPPFRLVSWEDAEAAAAAAAAGAAKGGMEGVTPGPRLALARQSSSRGRLGTPGDSAAGRLTAEGTLARAGTMSRTDTMRRTGTMQRA